ncbi:GEVED domain-containing protein [Parachitinimonas caeni]|uniref:GEVED domain-containing protein n=1 Tax=Parachitinimonas caeni TaxID=3031301 RepID=A0ABT7DV90_9NEIS|nr:GEVED domain-containing protein [Parachitinimonas caeni]MDK2123008.1 GEVED domain-containing protein [Parachitinimonas caeni]
MKVSPGFSFNGVRPVAITGWVDWNRDNKFERDELVLSKVSDTAISQPISVPATALPGPTRLRLILRGTLDPNQPSPYPEPCGGPSPGEVADFTLNVL